mmetsp:Transcript_28971/g.35765  ORF Transcript_28971/g.35765 Transcript_28971/m.35765 type:complete len:356 (+) Transcript_28971:197-1264(+)|eukprot:CAMPEP_0204843184 /NCGR_PEP_ID=MMETSP1346-20131115/47821_1 /ASSEMBLY_ACC=CAM_ASM_000771 /TAXON_ID=215587 /ORGANISM="Aplanochytrium stocchinoi, Strain GSBS06" /LENGTH=355 /DNA_ID=CAMNT_0051982281 /DNA_START=185 /DNA_END=1252 /DNA_ORIENTATION=-
MHRLFARTSPLFRNRTSSSRARAVFGGLSIAFVGAAFLSVNATPSRKLCTEENLVVDENEEVNRKHVLKEKRLDDWNGTGYTVGKLNRGDLHDVENHRHVIALIGVTGSGKSSTANTMLAGAHKRYFQVADSLTSVTRSVNFRDYEFQGVPFRIIDTPGFGDTNRPKGEIDKEIRDFSKFSRHGISCFFLVLPKGRVTEESEEILIRAKELFGDDFLKHAVLVFTHGLGNDKVGMKRNLLTRDILIEEINKLEKNHFLRELVEQIDFRVMAVENKLEPYRELSKFRLHKAVLDVEKANGSNRYLGIKVNEDIAESISNCREELLKHLNGETTITIRCGKGSDLPKLIQMLVEQLK